MKLNKATLPNGLRVLHVPVDDSQMVYVNLLYGQALLMADLPLEDPAEFGRLVCKLMK